MPTTTRRILAGALLGASLLLTAPPAQAAPPDPVLAAREQLLARFDAPPSLDLRGPGSRDLFLAVLGSELFLHRAVGPFDLYVMQADGLSQPAAARKTLDQLGKSLERLVPVVEKHFPAGEPDARLVGGQRFPIVVTEAGENETSFAELVALLDWAEDDWTGWKRAGNPIWSPDNLQAVTVRTWVPQLFNLGHAVPQEHGKAFLEHGLGYHVVAHLVARALRQGAWGMAPPWLADGLTDELDIEAYGEAWVGGDWWQRQTPGWYRAGWSGFVPQGASPPPPVTGPPASLGVTVSKTGDSWQHRSNSAARHWSELAADRKSEAPASFAFMAQHESFLPRDRALARATLHLLGELAPAQGEGLLALLDRPAPTPPSGMPSAEPLPVVMAAALGGVPAIDELEALSCREMLERIGKPELATQIEALGGGEALALSDHRAQGEWLYRVRSNRMNGTNRRQLFDLFLEAEYHQQLEEWRILGEVLDRGMGAALDSSRSYPKRDRDRAKVAEAFWTAIAAGPAADGDRLSRSRSRR